MPPVALYIIQLWDAEGGIPYMVSKIFLYFCDQTHFQFVYQVKTFGTGLQGSTLYTVLPQINKRS